MNPPHVYRHPFVRGGVDLGQLFDRSQGLVQVHNERLNLILTLTLFRLWYCLYSIKR